MEGVRASPEISSLCLPVVGCTASACGVLAATPSARHAGLCKPLLALPAHPEDAMSLSWSHQASCCCLQTDGSAGVQTAACSAFQLITPISAPCFSTKVY